jgi:hypothetical protein
VHVAYPGSLKRKLTKDHQPTPLPDWQPGGEMAFPKQITKIVGAAFMTAYLLCGAARPVLSADNAFTLPAAQRGKAYKFTIATAGGIPPLHWRLIAGTLPPGLVIDEKGEISGLATKAQVDAYQFKIEVSDSSQPAETYIASFRLTVNAPPLRMLLTGEPLRIVPVNGSAKHASTPAVAVSDGSKSQGGAASGGQQAPATKGNQSQGGTVAGAQQAHANGKQTGTTNPQADVSSPNAGNSPPVTALPQQAAEAKGQSPPAAAGAAAPAPAPGTLNACDQKTPTPPCVHQPQAGDTKVTGEVAVKSGASVPALDVKVNKADLGQTADLGPATVDPKTGEFSDAAKPLSEYDTVEVDQTSPTALTGTFKVAAANGNASPGQSFYTLGMAGLDITSTTTSGPQQQYFGEFDLLAPLRAAKSLGCDNPDPLRNRCWVWFDPRIASVPTPKTSQLQNLTSVSSALTGLSSMTLGDITQSVEFHGGFEYEVVNPREGILFGNQEKATLSLSAIAGGGVVTPFNSQATAQEFDLQQTPLAGGAPEPGNVVQQFNNNPSFAKQYPQLACVLTSSTYKYTVPTGLGYPKCSPIPSSQPAVTHVAFMLQNRSRFYRSYFAGLRFKTTFFNSDCNSRNINAPEEKECKKADVFPGIFDITIGQDENVTGGELRKFVLTLSGNYPFPGASWLRIFGSAYIGVSHNQYSPALVLPATQIPVALSDPSVVIQTLKPPNQDFFRLGVGIDIIKAWDALKQKMATSSPASPAGTGASSTGSKGSSK